MSLSNKLIEAVSSYTAIIDMLKKMAADLDTTDAVKLAPSIEALNSYIEETRKTDDKIRASLKDIAIDQSLDQHLEKYKNVLLSVSEEITNFKKNLITRQAILSLEINKIKQGRNTLRSYNPETQQSGGIVRRSC